jgi:hypothetical protein
MKLLGVGVVGAVLLVSGRQAFGQSAHEVALSADKLEVHNVKAQAATYQGRAAVRVTELAAADVDDAGQLAIIPGTAFSG